MKCPKCGSDTKVIDGRWHDIYKSYIRRRECIKCGYRFITGEKYIRDIERKDANEY